MCVGVDVGVSGPVTEREERDGGEDQDVEPSQCGCGDGEVGRFGCLGTVVWMNVLALLILVWGHVSVDQGPGVVEDDG